MSQDRFGDEWQKDKLKRIDEAKFLTLYLNGKYKKGKHSLVNGSFVLNVNANWGFGKTYFIKNWVDDLSKEGHPVVYFDAWENDFSKEPLVAFIATINSQLKPYFKQKIPKDKTQQRVKEMLTDWLDTSKKLIKPSFPLILGVLAKKLTGYSFEQLAEFFDEELDETKDSKDSNSENFEETQKAISSVVSNAATQMLASHNSTKKTINEFKYKLSKLIDQLDSLDSIQLPIYIFVDELDRCRPNYTIELLENIKHLFGVEGVFFIVATASEQLCHSIKAIYGQDFDSYNYLKRFFDQTYIMQEPDHYAFADYLFEKYNLAERDNIFSPFEDKDCTMNNVKTEVFALMTKAYNCGLRDMEQYCILIDSISLTFTNANLHLIYLLWLIIVKDKNKTLYSNHIKGIRRITIDDVKKDLVNFNVTFDTDYISESQINRTCEKRSFNIYELIWYYLALYPCTLETIPTGTERAIVYNMVKKEIYNEIPKQYQDKNLATHKLSLYPNLIEQAGRIV